MNKNSKNFSQNFLCGQNPLIWPLHIPIIQENTATEKSISKLLQTPPNFSKVLQTPSKLFQTLSTLVQTLSKCVQTCPNVSKHVQLHLNAPNLSKHDQG